jgi:hypothetical protein
MVTAVCVMAQLLPAASVTAKAPVEPLARWALVVGEQGQAASLRMSSLFMAPLKPRRRVCLEQ